MIRYDAIREGGGYFAFSFLRENVCHNSFIPLKTTCSYSSPLQLWIRHVVEFNQAH